MDRVVCHAAPGRQTLRICRLLRAHGLEPVVHGNPDPTGVESPRYGMLVTHVPEQQIARAIRLLEGSEAASAVRVREIERAILGQLFGLAVALAVIVVVVVGAASLLPGEFGRNIGLLVLAALGLGFRR